MSIFQVPSTLYANHKKENTINGLPMSGIKQATDIPDDHWTNAQLVTFLEKMLSRKAILDHEDMFLTSILMALGSLEIPISILLMHPTLSKVSKERLVEAVSTSDILMVDKERSVILPGLKSTRSTLILRDVATGATLEDIKNLLNDCPYVNLSENEISSTVKEDAHLKESVDMPSRINFLEFGGNNCWFLTLENGSMTQNVALWLKNKKIRNKPFFVRVKTESPLRVNLNISQTYFQAPPTLPGYIVYPPSLFLPKTKTMSSPVVEQGKPNYFRKNKFQSTGYKALCDFCEKKLQRASEPEGSPKKPSQSDGRCLCSFYQNKNTHRYKKKNMTHSNNNFHSYHPKNPQHLPHSSMKHDNKSFKMTYFKEGIPKHQYHLRTSHNSHIKKKVFKKPIEEFSIKKAPLSYKVSKIPKKKTPSYDFPPLCDEKNQDPTCMEALTHAVNSLNLTLSEKTQQIENDTIQHNDDSTNVSNDTLQTTGTTTNTTIVSEEMDSKSCEPLKITSKTFWAQKIHSSKTKQELSESSIKQNEIPSPDPLLVDNLTTKTKKKKVSQQLSSDKPCKSD